MHQQGKQQQPSLIDGIRQNTNVGIGVAQSLQKPWEAWLRVGGTMGSRHMGIQALLGWVFIPLYGGVGFPQSDQRPIQAFWFLTTLLLLWHRVWGLAARANGKRTHSRYVGDSRFARVFGQRLSLGLIEPLFAFIVGFFVRKWSEPLGCYLMLASGGLAISAWWMRESMNSHVRRWTDASIEAEVFQYQTAAED